MTGMLGGLLDFGLGRVNTRFDESHDRAMQKRGQRESKRNRAFQERMFKNRYQYSAEDMKRAGLNPMLMAGGASSSAPAGSVGHGGSGVSSAKQSSSSFGQNQVMKEQIKNLVADTNLKDSQSHKTDEESQTQAMLQNQIAAQTLQLFEQNKLTAGNAQSVNMDNILKKTITDFYGKNKNAHLLKDAGLNINTLMDLVKSALKR